MLAVGQNGINGAPSWITDPAINCGLVAGCYSCNASPPDLYFKLTFNLTTPVLIINWQVNASDWVQDIRVNGIMAYTTNIVPPGYPNQRGSAFNFNWCTNWKTGSNEIIVHVKVTPGYPSQCQHVGLLVHAWPGTSCSAISGLLFYARLHRLNILQLLKRL